jgi:hypothetical protein
MLLPCLILGFGHFGFCSYYDVDDDNTLQLKLCLDQTLHEFSFVCGCLMIARLFMAMLVYVVLLEFVFSLMMSLDANAVVSKRAMTSRLIT